MDLLRFPNERYFDKLVDLYREKYAGRNIDLIIATLRPSLDFLERYRDELFRGIPVLYTELDTRLLDSLPPNSQVAVVTGRFDMEGTLDLALGLHQHIREVFVVSGASQMDRELEGLARSSFRGFADRVRISYLTGLPMEELLRSLSALPEQSLIFFLTDFQDADGKAFLSTQALSLIAEVAEAPIYRISELFIGAGAVGARVYSFSKLGENTARSALRVLSGEQPGSVQLLEEKADRYVFDWHQLERRGISEDRLPPGSIIRNKDFSVWENYRWQILGLLLALILQAMLISALVIKLRKRRQANLALSESERQLQRAADEWKTTFDSIPDLIMLVDRDFHILRVNSALVSFCELSLDRILGSTCDGLVGETEKPLERSLLDKAMKTGNHEETWANWPRHWPMKSTSRSRQSSPTHRPPSASFRLPTRTSGRFARS
jgi:PAS domain-containing protein